MCLHTISSIMKAAYKTSLGAAYVGDSRKLLKEVPNNSINLVVTSPPFSLLRKKDYGNENQDSYVEWLAEFGEIVFQKLTSDGSLVIDIGGAYEKGIPVRSLYPFRMLLKFCDDIGFKLAEEFYWYNTAKLPSPIEWVNKRRIRVKDSVNTVWWLSKTEWPKANNKNVLLPYSGRMQELIKDPGKFYKPKKRPSGHDIGSKFGKDNGGSIPSNLLSFSNTESNSKYMAGCKKTDQERHPARFPAKLPEFFIKFLTDPGDVVLDIFAGSNTTGEAAEREKRRWISFEERQDYVATSIFRFANEDSDLEALHKAIMEGEEICLSESQIEMSY